MKLNPLKLIKSTDKQLRVLGFTRFRNRGWLRAAMDSEFSKEQIAEYYRLESLRPRHNLNKLKPEPLELPLFRGDGSPEDFANQMYEDNLGDFS